MKIVSIISVVLLAGCVSSADTNKYPDFFAEYLDYMECVSVGAADRLDANPSADIERTVLFSIEPCRAEFDAYQNKILEKQKRVNSVSVFDPVVKQELDKGLEQGTVTVVTDMLTRLYKEKR